MKFYTEREWPKCDVIVGNPPFIGNKRLRSELGDAYTKAVFDTFGDRLPATSDFCCYWFEKARELVAGRKCERAGLLCPTYCLMPDHLNLLWLGLCRYPLTVRVEDRLRRTNFHGWRLKSFCKTQYASLHGWEHFCRCHTAVIDLLAGARRLGLTVEIADEGDYWPGRDLEALRRSLDQMNAVVAAAAGVLKDCAEETGGTRVQSPILAHPHFERLEAEGAARGYASRLRRALRCKS